jgi:hypothetical protein
MASQCFFVSMNLKADTKHKQFYLNTATHGDSVAAAVDTERRGRWLTCV